MARQLRRVWQRPSNASPEAIASDTSLQKTPLHALHLELGAKMVPLRGYDMPVSYPEGILAEHRHRRERRRRCSTHGQVWLSGDDAAAALESLVPVDVVDSPGRQRYASSPTPPAASSDDLMITRREADFLVIVNAGCKDADIRHLQTNIAHRCSVQMMPERARWRLGAEGRGVDRLAPELRSLVFMTGGLLPHRRHRCFATRSGYTGEDGYEISVPPPSRRWRLAAAAGAARGEAGRPGRARHAAPGSGPSLYGHDIDDKTTPVEAGLTWAIQKVRCAGGARPAAIPAQRRSTSSLAAGPACKARRPRRPGARAGARGRDRRRRPGPPRRPASPAARWRPAWASRSRWLTWPPTTPCPTTRSTPRCAASASRCASALPFAPHRYHRVAPGTFRSIRTNANPRSLR